ncbi:MAG TPA: type II toxin-antitoxin system VapC family toxin [Acidobacteriota bacterium]|nr:type II toxin-antitoxin system VapC family toxin [Acidobacteriota bacterium]
MRLLLDTHIWIWSLTDPGRLSRRVSKSLHDPENEIWLSPISVWETLVLVRKGRLILEGKPEAWIREALSKASLKEATLNHEVAIVSSTLRLAHQDPADRLLAATAIVYDLILVTADERLLGARQVTSLANR